MALLMEQRLLDKGEKLEGFFGSRHYLELTRISLSLFIERNRTSMIMEPLKMEREDFNVNRSTTAARSLVIQGGYYY